MSFSLSKTQIKRLIRATGFSRKLKHPNKEKAKAQREAKGFNAGPPKKKNKPWLKK
jgi:hypothetical protein